MSGTAGVEATMRFGIKTAMISLAGACVLFVAAPMRAQAPPPDILQTAKKCKPKSKDPACQAPTPAPAAAPSSTAADNPFPVEESHRNGDGDGTVMPVAPAPSANGLPAAPTGNDADPPAESNKPMRMPRDGYTTGGGSSSSDAAPGDVPASGGGSSSSRSHDADDDVAPTTAAPDAPVKASKLKDLGSSGSFSEAHAKLEKTRFDDDLKVGKFYMQDGNPQGAYLRYKDAVDHVPDDPDARFGLAEAANKLKKRDEAILNYRETIKADPGGDHDKAARYALKELGVAAQ